MNKYEVVRPLKKMSFPLIWSEYFDGHVPREVKKRYFKKKGAAKSAPTFIQKDAWYFLDSVQELSELLTTERKAQPGKRAPLLNYFQHPRFRSAYLLYLYPLQAAKFYYLFDLHRDAIRRLVKDREKIRVLDIGAGPGSASAAFLLYLATQFKNPPEVEFIWMDSNRSILSDGESLLSEAPIPAFPNFSIKSIASNWAKFRFEGEYDFVMIGNFLNELPSDRSKKLERLLKHTQDGRILFVEPAFREAGQKLSQIREELLPSSGLVGPCLHTGSCPLSSGTDWCHFSFPVEFKGKWFNWFSKELASRRNWLKFSYLWLDASAKTPEKTNQKLLISDNLSSKGRPVSYLVCAPERYEKILPRKRDLRLHRGEIIK